MRSLLLSALITVGIVSSLACCCPGSPVAPKKVEEKKPVTHADWPARTGSENAIEIERGDIGGASFVVRHSLSEDNVRFCLMAFSDTPEAPVGTLESGLHNTLQQAVAADGSKEIIAVVTILNEAAPKTVYSGPLRYSPNDKAIVAADGWAARLPKKTPPPPPVAEASRDNYHRLKQGMTLAECQGILGGGKEDAQGPGIQIVTWQKQEPGFGGRHTIITGTFQNGRLASKIIVD